MAIALIPLDSGQASAIDELAGTAPLFINMLVTGPPGNARPVRTRPGIRPWLYAPSYFSYFGSDPIVAMAALDDNLFFVSDDGAGAGNRNVYNLAPDGTLVWLSSTAAGKVSGAETVSLVVGRSHVIATGGGAPQKISPGTSTPLGGSPPHAIDAAFIAQFLVLVRSGSDGVFFYSEPGEGGIETWDLGLNYTEAEARPDALVGCRETARELFMFGATTTQVFVPDEEVVWAPISTMETGCLAKGSILRWDQMMVWLDDRRRIVASGGRGIDEVLSDRGLAATLETLQYPAEVWSARIKIGNHDLLMLSFWKDGRAFAFDTISQTWSEWRRWHEDRWQAWAPRSHLWWPERKVHLVGMDDGTIAELSLEAYTDLDDPLKWHLRTGFREAEARRQVWEARFPVRRGEATSTASDITVAWRDDLGDFTPPIAFPLGQAEQKDADITVSPAGMPYKRRQYELQGNGADAYSIGVGKEIYEEVEF